MQTLVTGIALEVSTRTKKDDDTKSYSSLIMYERGKQYPELLKINLKPEQINQAKTLVGHEVCVDADVVIFQNRANLNFLAGRPMSSKAA